MLVRQLAADRGLSAAETRVLLLIIKHPNVTMPRLGTLLGIGARTTQFHASNIYSKLGVGNRRGLNAFLVAREYNTPDDMIRLDTDPSGAYILRLETAIKAWVAGSDHQLTEIANELA